MKPEDDFFKVNKATWNEKTKVHVQSEFYDLEAFKNGKSSLMPYEIEELAMCLVNRYCICSVILGKIL